MRQLSFSWKVYPTSRKSTIHSIPCHTGADGNVPVIVFVGLMCEARRARTPAQQVGA